MTKKLLCPPLPFTFELTPLPLNFSLVRFELTILSRGLFIASLS